MYGKRRRWRITGRWWFFRRKPWWRKAAVAVGAAVLLAADPSAAAKAVVVAEAKEVADLLVAAGLISPVLPVQAVRFFGVAPLSEAHLPAVPIILVVAPEVLRAAV